MTILGAHLHIALDYAHVLGTIWLETDRHRIDQDVALIVTDGGEPYELHSPFKLIAAGWVSSGKGTPLAVTPLQWKPYVPRPKKR